MSKTRKVLMAIVVIFCVYAVVKYPVQSASTVSDAVQTVMNGLQAVGKFFNSLISG